MSKVHNFSAGPAILPPEVLKAGQDALENFKNLGLSVVEISHRSKQFIDTMEEARDRVRKLMGLPDHYEVLFLQGGAQLQFSMAPYNLLPADGTAAYLDTGSWSDKAIKEARLFGSVQVVASSKESNYSYIPKEYEVPEDAVYFHITTNNTIFGTQIAPIPKSPVPLVCDMSSDILSRRIDFTAFDLIYAGAQKNLGPAGTTLVVVNKERLGHAGRSIPSMLDYQVHAKKDSMFNTPPVFPVFMVNETLKWIEAEGGLEAIEARNNEKARIMYEEIDRNPLFQGTVTDPDSRSKMNATFVPVNPEHQQLFLDFCQEANISGMKGHRSVGGFRASMYNALEKSSVEHLVDVMQEFEKKYATNEESVG
jgi:phosphoserine aminotransferase